MRAAPLGILLAAASALASDVPLADLSLAGAATLESKALRLTAAREHQAGAAWLRDKQTIGGGFDTSFRFRVSQTGGLGGGADGFAFVIQNSGPAALGGTGSGGGFALGDDSNASGRIEAIPQSIAVFFDTFRNEDIGDPSNNFVTVCTAGTPRDLHWPPPRLASSKKLRVNLKDHKAHLAHITYQPPALTVYLDNKRVLAATVDLTTVLGPDGAAWVGFTASTGAGFENHDVLSWSLTHGAATSTISYLKTACLPDRNLCTPEQPTVEQKTPGLFHVILPGNLEWSAEIPNPSGHSATILNARGSVCRDVARLGAAGCVGPAALIQRTAGGRTSFNVNLPGDSQANEGYFEFDAQVP